MDTFPLHRMAFDSVNMVNEPPFQSDTGRTIRDLKDPEYITPEVTYLDLNSEIEEWWV